MISAFGVEHGEISKADKRVVQMARYGEKISDHFHPVGTKNLKMSSGHRRTAGQLSWEGAIKRSSQHPNGQWVPKWGP